MPLYDLTDKESGKTFQAEFQNPPSSKDVDEIIQQYRAQNKPASSIESAEAGALQSIAPSAGAAVGSVVGRWAGVEAGAELGAISGAMVPGLGETGLSEAVGGIAGGLGGAIFGGSAVDWVQQKILPQRMQKWFSEAHEDNPKSFDAGEIAASAAAFRFSPGHTIRGIADIAQGKLTTKAANAAAVQIGLGAGLPAAQSALSGQYPDRESMLVGAIQMGLLGNPRFTAKHGATAPAQARDNAKEAVGSMTEAEKAAAWKNLQTGNPPGTGEKNNPAAHPEPTDEEIDKRLGEIDDMRKAGGLSGQTREEKRLLKMKADRAVKQPAKQQTIEEARQAHDNLQEQLHSMMEGGIPDDKLEPIKQQIKELQDKWGDQLVPPEISPEGKALLKEHGKDKPEIITDDQVGEAEAPFAKGRADRGWPAWTTIGGKTGGKIVIHRRNFQDWLDSITPSRRSQAVQSLLSEEHIHSVTDPNDARAYWKQMTAFEKWAMKYRYDPEGDETEDFTDVHWGAESIRYHLQQMMRMTPTEVAQEYGGKGATSRRLKIQAVDILDGIVRKARNFLTDGTSKVILDRVARNLDIARNSLSGNVTQTEPAPYAGQARQNSDALMALAAEFRKAGNEAEAKELEDMAKQSAEWAKDEVEPVGVSGRSKKEDKNQGIFEDLLSLSRFESMRAMINEGRGAEMAANAGKQLFKQAQAESGQKPTQEVGVAGRGRPKRDPASKIFIKSEASGAQKPLFDDPSIYLSNKGAKQQVPSGERELGEKAPKPPTDVEIEAAAQKWVSDELGKAAEQEGKKGGGLPDVEDYEKYMQRNYHVQPGQARQFYQDALTSHLSGASGEELQSLLKASFGPDSILGRMRVPDETSKVGDVEGDLVFKGLIEFTKSEVTTQESKELEELRKKIPKVAQNKPLTMEQKEAQKERAPERRELTTGEAMQQRRQKAIALVFNKAMAVTTAEDPSLLARKEIFPSEIRTAPKFGEGGLETLSAKDEQDPELEERLYNDSRRSNRDKASISRRILVVSRKSDDSIHQVSVWKNPTSNRMFMTNPDLPNGEGLNLKDALKRYRLLETYSLDYPVEKFHKRFGSIDEYEEKFGAEAKEFAQAASQYDPSQTSEQDFVRSTAPTVTGEDESGNIGPVQTTEGINEGGTGFVMGPDKDEVTGTLGIGGGDFQQRSLGKITSPEAEIITRVFGEAKTVDDAKRILKGLSWEKYKEAKDRWKAAADRVRKAEEAVSRSETQEGSPGSEDVQIAKGAQSVEEARKKLRAALYEAARATANLTQEAALRSGVAKIAQRYQRLYGTRESSEYNKKREQVPAEDLLRSLAKSIFAASLKGVLRADPLAAIKSLGGDRSQPSAWDRTQTPSGRELTMLNRRPPTDVKSLPYPKQSESPAPVPPPADAMTPAPVAPIETLDGETFRSINNSLMTPERRLEIGMNIIHLTPEEQAEIAQAQKVAEYFARRNATRARQAQALTIKQKPTLTREQWMDQHGVEGAPGVKSQKKASKEQEFFTFTGPERDLELPRGPKQQDLRLGRAGRYSHESNKDRADYLSLIGLSWLERSPLRAWVAEGWDAYHNIAHNFARKQGNGVRFVGGKENTKETLGAAIAMHATLPFTKKFVYDEDARNEFRARERENPDVQLAHTLLTQDPHNIKLQLQQEIDKNPRTDRANELKGLIGRINSTIGRAKPILNAKGQTTGWSSPEGDALGMVRLEGARILKEAHRRIENDLLKHGWLTHEGAEYVWDESRKYKLDEFLQLLEMGERKAAAILKNGGSLEKLDAKRWLDDIAEHRNNVEYAKAHWGDKQLQAVTERAARELDAQYDRENANGAALDYNDAYLPGRYDAQLYQSLSVTFAPQIAGTRYSRGKAYDNYYQASAADINIAATHDISNLVEHRVRQGMVSLGKDNWQHELTSVEDPSTGKRAYAMAKPAQGGRWVPDLKAGESERDYEAVSADATRRPIFALHGSFADLMSQLVTPSAIQKSTFGQVLLKTSQALKHVATVGDIFHLSRLSLYSGSINGLKGLNFWRGANHIPGWAALDFNAKDLPNAKAAGVLDDSDLKWLTEKVPFQMGGVKSTISRMDAAKQLEKVGFNVGRIGDAIYKDLVSNIPVLGRYNNWLFDKFTRGLMMKSALQEFERIQKLEPATDSNDIMRRVSYDLNRFFGSIGRQGWIKSNTFQDLSRIIFLSPQWVEGLISKDASIPYKAITSLYRGPKGLADLLTGHETQARGIARGLLGMFVLTQVINMITRHQPTYQNEEGHKWEADIGENTWINPLSVFNEMAHELIRYGETKDKFWDALRQIGENKLGFIGRAALVGLTSTTSNEQYLTTTSGVLKAAAQEAMPVPMTMGPEVQQMGSMLTGGRINPPRAADVRRSEAALFGIKAQVDQTEESKLYTMAQKFVKANKLSADMQHPMQTDEPSYSKLRSELRLGNEAGARNILEGLRKGGNSERQVIEAMSRWNSGSFTGSRRNEVLWLRSLTPEELSMYRQAVTARRDLYQKWLAFYTADKQANTIP